MASLQLPTHSYRLRSTPASTARLVNCYPEALPAGAKTPLVLTRAPGVTGHATPGTGPIRGMHAFDGDLFVVSGTSLYRVDDAGTETLVGTIPGTAAVSMDHNDEYLVIVTNPDGYYTDGATVTQITDTDFTDRGAKYVKFNDNFMVFTEPGTGRYFWADVGSVVDFDALNFTTSEGNPDVIVGMETDHGQVVLFGENSTEIHDVGDDGFTRMIGGFIEIGCFNGDTVAKFDSGIAFVANDYSVRKLEGTNPRRISTNAVEIFLSSVDVSTLRAYSYTQDGHFFYVVCCSSGCFAYDAASGEWAERATYPEDYFEWQYHCTAHGRQYVGNYYSSDVGYFSPTDYDENGGIQRMEATFQPVYAENKKARHNRLEIVLETGVGLVSGQGSDPEIMMAYSDDGGKTYTNLPNRRIGAIGEYRHRVWWSGLGSASQRVYRMAVSDPIKVTICQAVLDVDGGRI